MMAQYAMSKVVSSIKAQASRRGESIPACDGEVQRGIQSRAEAAPAPIRDTSVQLHLDRRRSELSMRRLARVSSATGTPESSRKTCGLIF